MLHIFHTYVASVCFRYFICFVRMLHSSVLCCMCFMLFGELGVRGVMVARHGHRGMARDDLGMEVAHGAPVSCRQGMLSVGSRGATVAGCVRGGPNDFKSRWAGRAPRERQVV
jgi:hypothetical protein